MFKKLLMGLVMASTVAAQDSPCPDILVPHQVTRTTVDCITVTEGTIIYPTRVLEPLYSDNRLCIQYFYWIDGQVLLRNITDVDRTVRYRIEISLVNVPFVPTNLSPGICYDPVQHTLVLYLEASVPAQGEYLVEFAEWADWAEWNPDGADLNGDYRVDGADLALLQALWGTDDPTADLNNDGIVDGGDIAIILSNWSDSAM